jgi:uncharacterized membrane protein
MIILCFTGTIAYIERLVQNGCNFKWHNHTMIYAAMMQSMASLQIPVMVASGP